MEGIWSAASAPRRGGSGHVRLGADLEVDVLGGALGVVGGLGAGLDVGRHAVVVARGEEVEVVQALEGDRVLRRAEADGRRVARHLALGDVVRRLRAEQEAVAADDGVRGEGRALQRDQRRICGADGSCAYLEEVEERAGVQAGLLVRGRDQRGLAGAVGGERGVQVELEALGKVVLRLDLGAEEVGGGPGLGEDEAVGLVGVLGLQLAGDSLGLVILAAGDLEGDVGRGDSLDLEVGAREVVVLAQQVVGGLAEILRVAKAAQQSVLAVSDDARRTFQDGGTG